MQTIARYFCNLGYYEPTRFILDNKALAKCCGVYIWAHLVDGIVKPLRVGMATCLQGRYSRHNTWLRIGGRPGDPNNQETCRLTKLGAGSGMIILAREMPDGPTAGRLETVLRDHLGSLLALDLMAPGSWIRQQQDLFIEQRRKMR